MTLIEINLEKPALIEERASGDGEAKRTRRTGKRATSSRTSRGRSAAKPLLGLLLTAVAMAVGRKLRARRKTDTDDEYGLGSEEADRMGEPSLGADEAKTGGRARKAKAAGFVGGFVMLALIARKLRGRSSN